MERWSCRLLLGKNALPMRRLRALVALTISFLAAPLDERSMPFWHAEAALDDAARLLCCRSHTGLTHTVDMRLPPCRSASTYATTILQNMTCRDSVRRRSRQCRGRPTFLGIGPRAKAYRAAHAGRRRR